MKLSSALLFLSLSLALPAVLPMPLQAADAPKEMLVYIGTYTRAPSKGIYCFRLDMATGSLKPAGVTEGIKNPSFLAIHPTGKFLYAVSEVSDGGKSSGAVSAFALDRANGQLSPLNHQSSEGAGPCHVSVDRTGKVVLVANYGSGSIASLPLKQDGSLAPAASAIQHEGMGADPARQKGPHAHSINTSPDNRFVYAADLGLDKIMIYQLDPNRGTLTPNDPAFAAAVAGGGPRHFAFHPGGKFAYVCNEMKSSVTAFYFDAGTGGLTELQTISTLPDGFSANNSTAEIQVHPLGRFLYCSNRGHDSLAIYAIDEKSGKLTAVGHQSTLGKTPRNFGIDPTGTFVIACNQASNTIVVFKVDQATGGMVQVGEPIEVGSPVCVKFLPLP